jgi:hypothetical protein
MARHRRRFASWFVAGALFAVSAPAYGQVIQNCLPNQYLDRTATNADRELNWDFGIETDPEHCLQVAVGQKVTWVGNQENHPLGGQGGDNPNPIGLNENGVVTFTTPGTFGFFCLNHSTMKGAIRVVEATAPVAVPAATPSWLTTALTVLLFASGLSLIRSARRAPA